MDLSIQMSEGCELFRSSLMISRIKTEQFSNITRGSAMAILDSGNWQSALKNCTVEGNKIVTPMRKLIKKLPGINSQFFSFCASLPLLWDLRYINYLSQNIL